MDYPELSCRIGDTVEEALFISESMLICLLSSSFTPPGIVSLSITLNGQDYSDSASPSPFLIVQTELTLLSVSPKVGSYRGYTPVVIEALGLMADQCYLCVFDGISIIATVSTDLLSLTCVSPPLVRLSDRVVTATLGISVPGDSDRLSINTLPYQYIPDVVVSGVSVRSGPTSGGTKIMYSLQKPLLLDILDPIPVLLEFNSVITVASMIFSNTANEIHCTTPSTPFSALGFTTTEPLISFNAVDFFPIGVAYTYYNAIEALSVYPSKISLGAETSMIITTNGTTLKNGWLCRLGANVSPGAFIPGNNTLSCTVRADVLGLQTLSVSGNGLDWSEGLIVQVSLLTVYCLF
jgi:hypothetical protein